MPSEKRADTASLIVNAAELSVLFVPVYVLAFAADSLDLGEIVSILLLLAPAYLCGMLTAALTRSRTVPQALGRMGLSFLFTVFFWQWMADAQLLVRAVNWSSPGYGDLSAGAGFAAMIQMFVLAAGDLIGVIAGIAVSREQSRPALWKGLRIAAHSVCALVLTAFIVLSFVMPPYYGVVG